MLKLMNDLVEKRKQGKTLIKQFGQFCRSFYKFEQKIIASQFNENVMDCIAHLV